MTVISAQNVVVDFPVYGGTSRSLKNKVMHAATGGLLACDASDRIVSRALDDVSFDFYDGDRIGLVGHNGSGKSTLLRLLAGIYQPTSGFLEVNGHVTSMLSITLGMDAEATGMENIYMRGNIMGIRPRQMKKLIEDIVDFSGLGDYIYLPIRTYSSGMTMRLAFAICTSVDADIILMDEWISVGDAEFAEKSKARLDRLVGNARIVVLASHDHAMIDDRCNKTIHLEHGKILSLSSAIQVNDLIGNWIGYAEQSLQASNQTVSQLPDGSLRLINDQEHVASGKICGNILDCKEWNVTGQLSPDKKNLVWSNGSIWHR